MTVYSLYSGDYLNSISCRLGPRFTEVSRLSLCVDLFDQKDGTKLS